MPVDTDCIVKNPTKTKGKGRNQILWKHFTIRSDLPRYFGYHMVECNHCRAAIQDQSRRKLHLLSTQQPILEPLIPEPIPMRSDLKLMGKHMVDCQYIPKENLDAQVQEYALKQQCNYYYQKKEDRVLDDKDLDNATFGSRRKKSKLQSHDSSESSSGNESTLNEYPDRSPQMKTPRIKKKIKLTVDELTESANNARHFLLNFQEIMAEIPRFSKDGDTRDQSLIHPSISVFITPFKEQDHSQPENQIFVDSTSNGESPLNNNTEMQIETAVDHSQSLGSLEKLGSDVNQSQRAPSVSEQSQNPLSVLSKFVKWRPLTAIPIIPNEKSEYNTETKIMKPPKLSLFQSTQNKSEIPLFEPLQIFPKTRTVFLLLAHEGITQPYIWQSFFEMSKYGCVLYVSHTNQSTVTDFFRPFLIAENMTDYNRYGDLMPTIMVMFCRALLMYPNLEHACISTTYIDLIPGNSVPIKHFSWYSHSEQSVVCFDHLNWKSVGKQLEPFISYSNSFSIIRYFKINNVREHFNFMIKNAIEICEFEAGFYNSANCVFYPDEFCMWTLLFRQERESFKQIIKSLDFVCFCYPEPYENPFFTGMNVETVLFVL